MPLMREFGTLERQRLHAGVTPLEYQRWLDLKGKIGKSFAKTRRAGLERAGGESSNESAGARLTRLVLEYRSRDELLDSVVDHIRPVGLFVPTPFAAEVGTNFLARVTLELEGDSADLPVCVVTSISEGAQTLSTMSMGMGVKLLKPNRAQAAGVSKLFAGELDGILGLGG